MEDLKKLRDRIDWLDSQIASLLNERMSASDRVGEIKRNSQQDITDPSREKNVLNHVEGLIQHPLLKANIANIYGEIMQESRTAQKFFKHLSQPFRQIGIVGLGLIGGSICKAIKTKDPSIIINSLNHHSEDLSLACEGGWIDQIYQNMAELVEHSELIILASPISTIIPLAKELKQHLNSHKKMIIMDVASVKSDITTAFEKLSDENMEFISTHPMAGKELSGFANCQATLFVNRPWIIIPHHKNQSDEIKRMSELLLYLGSDPINLEAPVHDRQAALISHIPSLLAKSYYDFVQSIDAQSMMIAGPGFQSFTRLAHDNQGMIEEISQYNHQSIQDYLNQWLEYVKKHQGH